MLSYLVTSLLKVRSVNFNHLATGYHNGAQLSSKLRRIQRFFREFTFQESVYCQLLMQMLPISGPYRLSLDRTNWQLGKRNINILFLSVLYKGVGLPIFWRVLGDKRGNSCQEERKALLRRFMDHFGKNSIEYLTADREFIGQEWLTFLATHQIHFFIRVRSNLRFTLCNGQKVKAHWLLMAQPLNQVYFHPKIVYLQNTLLYYSGLKYVNQQQQIEYLILVSYQPTALSLEIYKNRWQIETMFRAFKSAGFHLENTHIHDYRRLDTLIKVVAIAFIWSYNLGIDLNNKHKQIPVKKHGRRAVSFFTYGLDFLSQAFINNIKQAIRKALKLFLSCT